MQAQKVVPEQIGQNLTRSGRLGFAFGRRFYILAALGALFLAPAFADPWFLWVVLFWNVGVLMLWLVDLMQLPKPESLAITRVWLHALTQTGVSPIQLRISNFGNQPIEFELADDVPASFGPPIDATAKVAPGQDVVVPAAVVPKRRGDFETGIAFLRYRSAWGFAERWAKAELKQKVRVYPKSPAISEQSIYLIRSRQIELEKRFHRRQGLGREFEALREYREGDNLRDVSWAATARRSRLVVKEYQLERSQPIWLVVDCGRLMRARVGEEMKLDYAAAAALSLAQVAIFGGDRVGLLAYGQQLQRLVGLGKGTLHLRNIMEQLALAKEEQPEANHLAAAAKLLSLQSRRGLVVWLTDIADTAMMPEVIEGAFNLLSRHLVLFATISDPALKAVANRYPTNPEELYLATAARDIVHRREVLLSSLRARGAHTIEVGADGLSSAVVEKYFSLKEKNLI
jgi:uncharacterized protein (DUF58 family)